MVNYNLNKSFQLQLDERKLEKVLNNLLSNALKFTPMEGKVTMTVNDKQSWIEIIVEDTGIGMEQTMVEELMNAGQLLAVNYDEEKKTGLGLAITKQLVQLHGGNIKVESKD